MGAVGVSGIIGHMHICTVLDFSSGQSCSQERRSPASSKFMESQNQSRKISREQLCGTS